MNKKWIILFKLPSGLTLAASVKDDKFAMVPVSKDGQVKGAMCWDSKESAVQFWKNMTRIMDAKMREGFRRMKMKYQEIEPTREYGHEGKQAAEMSEVQADNVSQIRKRSVPVQ